MTSYGLFLIITAVDFRWVNRGEAETDFFSYFSAKTYVVGTQKKHPKHMFKLIDKEKMTILR